MMSNRTPLACTVYDESIQVDIAAEYLLEASAEKSRSKLKSCLLSDDSEHAGGGAITERVGVGTYCI